MKTLIEELSALKLDAFAASVEREIGNHPEAREAIIDSISNLAKAEIAARKERSVAYRIQQARLGQIQTIDAFDFNYNQSTKKIKSRYLKFTGADMIGQGISALFVGGCGLGKTHLARALGYRLCQDGHRVLFTTIARMAMHLTASDSTGQLKRAIDHYAQPALLILDEVGYVSLRELESNLVFQIVSTRYDKRRPFAVTTNRPFGEWNQIFHNDAIAHAILDRLAHRSEVFYLEGKGYRETHRERIKT